VGKFPSLPASSGATATPEDQQKDGKQGAQPRPQPAAGGTGRRGARSGRRPPCFLAFRRLRRCW